MTIPLLTTKPLADELAADPMPETQTLYTELTGYGLPESFAQISKYDLRMGGLAVNALGLDNEGRQRPRAEVIRQCGAQSELIVNRRPRQKSRKQR